MKELTGEDRVRELETLLSTWLNQYCHITEHASVENYRPISARNRPEGRPSLAEADAFMFGLSEGLIAVSEIGHVSFPDARFKPQWALPLFWRNSKTDPNTPILFWWELLTQVRAYVELVRWGWDPADLGVDVLSDLFDVAAYEKGAGEEEPFIAGEAKASTPGVRRLVADLDKCRALGCVPSTKHSPDGHKTYLGLQRVRPTFFWAIGPEDEHRFSVHTAAARVELSIVDSFGQPPLRI